MGWRGVNFQYESGLENNHEYAVRFAGGTRVFQSETRTAPSGKGFATMGIYEDIGVRPVINAIGTATRYGGALLAPEIMETMRVASREFCPLDELHEKAGEKVAGMLGVEAAYVTASAACGLVITTAASMTGTDPERIRQLPDTAGMRDEVIVQKTHRIAYDQAIRLTGAKLVELDDADGPPVESMRAAIGDGTRATAVFYLGKNFRNANSVPLEQAVAMAHAADVPVIVDAASECPPVSTLTRFTDAGADLVIFSGGKSLQGPQSTGLIVGRKDLIGACAVNGTPFATVGRPMKVSREEIFAFIKALEIYLDRDHAADAAAWENKVRYIEGELSGIPHVTLGRLGPEETYAVPQLKVTIGREAGLTGDDAVKALLDGDPRIIVQDRGGEGFSINPHNLQDGQERVVAQRCREVLAGG